ncbi:MAG TPA: hypothetical protein VI008_03400, partial [Rubrobacter sp.]
HASDVHERQHHGERTVDEGTVYDHVYVVEAVTKDGVARRKEYGNEGELDPSQYQHDRQRQGYPRDEPHGPDDRTPVFAIWAILRKRLSTGAFHHWQPIGFRGRPPAGSKEEYTSQEVAHGEVDIPIAWDVR